jgi:ABC-2 type transport system ATP-binding protein
MFTDLIKPSKGQALINGVNVHTNKKHALVSVGALIETPEIYSSLTPREALNMLAELRGVPKNERKKRIEAVLEEVRMSEWIDKRIGKFSKGMKQRVCFASALLNNPEIILLDEPTTGLDPRGMSEVRDIIKALKREDRLIFMSSHLLGEVSDVCDEVAMINHGKLLIYDNLTKVTAKFSNGIRVVEVGLNRSIDKAVVTKNIANLQGVTAAEKVEDRYLKISFNGDADMQEQILNSLVKLNIGVISYKPASSGLEDAYLKLITGV